MNQSPPPSRLESTEPELAEYRSLSLLAVLGLALGLVSAAALLDPLAWVLPVLAAVVSLAALRRIAREPQTLAGRKVAWAGLTLSLLFGAAAPCDWFLYRYLLAREAVAFARPWFQLLGQHQTHNAYLLTVDPRSRLPLNLSLPELCRRAPHLCTEFEEYRRDAVVKTLEALGPTRVRLLRVDDHAAGSDRDFARPVFEVTADAGSPTTLRVALSMERVRLRGGEGWRLGRADWRILRAEIQPL
jgi:hypothetical protein